MRLASTHVPLYRTIGVLQAEAVTAETTTATARNESFSFSIFAPRFIKLIRILNADANARGPPFLDVFVGLSSLIGLAEKEPAEFPIG